MNMRIMIADDHILIRKALRALLEQCTEFDVVAEAGDGQSVLKYMNEFSPDIILMDIAMPGLNGVETTRQLLSSWPDTKIIALSAHAEKHFVEEMLEAGAQGFVSKSASGDELQRAIRSVSESNKTYICSEISSALADAVRNRFRGDGPSTLGKREREVLKLLSEGLRSARIADQLHIAPCTVEVHRRNIMRKLNLHTVAELTKYAIREGITQA